MIAVSVSAALLALIWGAAYALFLQRTRLGAWLCNRRTWLTVVVGIGVDLVIMSLVVPFEHLLAAAAVIALSSIGVIARSIANELAEQHELERIYEQQPAADECDQQS